MTDELVTKARRGGPCVENGDQCPVMNAASGCFCAAVADRIEVLTLERNKAILGNHRFTEHQPTWAELTNDWKARAEAAAAERDRLREDLEELDFLRHEGGPDSVAAIEAERDRLRKALAVDPWFLGRREWAMHIKFALKGETP